MTQEEIKERFPSTCWDCSYARATWSEELEKQGMCGFTFPIQDYNEENRVIFEITDVESFGEGWIYSSRKPFLRGKEYEGILGNFQPILSNVKSCKSFKQ